MTIAHLSDTHLGFRAFGRTRPDGANAREVDVLETFERTLDAILERSPDLVIHAGDLFHVVRPSNLSLVGGYRAIERFQAARHGKPFVIVGGNHDVPRAGTGGILQLLAGIPGVLLAERDVTTWTADGVPVVAVPSVALRAGALKELPHPENAILTLHGMSRQALPKGRGEGDFDGEAFRHEDWKYVALGDYHVFQRYGPNVCYSGSTDFASTNVWDEARHAKGWVWFDDEAGILEFAPVKTRPVIDLPPIDAAGMSANEVEEAMLAAAQGWPDERPIVRQRVIDAAPGMRARIRPAVVRELASRTMAYQLVVSTAAPEVRAYGPGRTLEDAWREHVGAVRIPAGLSRDEIETAGLVRLREAAESDPGPADA